MGQIEKYCDVLIIFIELTLQRWLLSSKEIFLIYYDYYLKAKDYFIEKTFNYIMVLVREKVMAF